MKKILLLLVLAIFIIPVSAGNYSSLGAGYLAGDVTTFEDVTNVEFDLSGEGTVFTQVEIYKINQPGLIEFELTQGNGATHTGLVNYSVEAGIINTCYFTLELDSDSKSWSGMDVTPEKVFLTSYARDEDTQQTGLLISEVSLINFILMDGKCVFSEVSDIEDYPLVKLTLTSTNPISVGVTYAETGTVQDAMDNENIDVLAWIGNILSFAGSAGTIIFGLIYVFKLLFVDHLLSIIVLYESVCMAYSASQSRDIISFLRKFVRYNRALVEALIGFISVVISIFHKIIDALKIF
jgi:hypothetical protein